MYGLLCYWEGLWVDTLLACHCIMCLCFIVHVLCMPLLHYACVVIAMLLFTLWFISGLVCSMALSGPVAASHAHIHICAEVLVISIVMMHCRYNYCADNNGYNRTLPLRQCEHVSNGYCSVTQLVTYNYNHFDICSVTSTDNN